MMRRLIASLLVAPLLVGLGAAMARAEPAPTTCDTEQMSQPGRAQVIGADRLHFVKDGDGCPDDSASCQERSYVMPGDVLLTGVDNDDFTCAYFPNHARGVSGWVKTDRLKVLPPFPTPKLADWAGVWVDDNDTLRLTPNGGELLAEGTAFAGTEQPPAGTAPGATITGASLRVLDNFTMFEQHRGRHDCILSVTLMGDALEVADNADCGSAKARFDGEYRRAK
jgi:hypothetical protein